MQNGDSHAHAAAGLLNHHAMAPEQRIGPNKRINRTEYVRLLQQALHKLGYSDVAQHLQQESGIEMQPAHATELQTKVLAGDWAAAAALLPALTQRAEVLREARFLIAQQKYLEALEGGDVNGALGCLRGEVAPLAGGEVRLHQLAGLLLRPLSSDASFGGAAFRSSLLNQLQSKLPPSLMPPPGRLEELVEQALGAQMSKCQYHNAGHDECRLSLFSDYQAGIESLPTRMVQVLDSHTDEVWHVQFSHNGTMLATASKDKTSIIWSVKPNAASVTAVHVLTGHCHPVASLAWSPDDRLLLTCSDDTLRLWDAASGQLLHTFSSPAEAVTCCAWMPDSKRFLSGSVDKAIHMFEVDGSELQRWKRPYRVQDMVVSHNGTCVIVACSDQQIRILRLSDQQEVALHEASLISSIALSPDSSYLLANLQSNTLHLWALGNACAAYSPSALSSDPLVALNQSASGYLVEYRVNDGKPGRYVLRSSFGGSDGTFVVHGSEDNQVYVWHRDSGDLLLKLNGHTGTVNSVSWNTANPHMLATASDDHTVRVWLAAAALQPNPLPFYGGGGGSSNGLSGS